MSVTRKLGYGLKVRIAHAVGGGALLLSVAVPGAAWAAKSYQFSGKVTGVREDTIAVSRGIENLEFNRGARGLSRIKVGDEITIRYQLEAESVERVRSPRQQPGRAAPAGYPTSPPIEKKHIIIDDRAFYDARREIPAVDASRRAV